MNDSAATAAFNSKLRDIPVCLHAEVQQTRDQFRALLPEFVRATAHADWSAFAASAAKVWAGSEFVAHSCLRDPQLWDDLIASGDLARVYDAGELRGRIAALARTADVVALKPLLRKLRHREAVRIAWRDLAGWANLREVMSTLSELADACLQATVPAVQTALAARHGTPIGERSGSPQSLAVFALGKLGGGELNFSSDIDLVLAYPEDGETSVDAVEQRGLSNHEFFLRAAREVVAVLSEATGDGFVFRVDLRLRPNGASGPLALSFDAMEHYYQTHGREWERYAWIKARAVAGDTARGEELLARLRPFVYRKYFDYGAIAAIREMKATIEREVERKGMEHNIKTGIGGIREIEFTGQVFQLIRGGREPQLQAREIQTVLAALAKSGYLTRAATDELTIAYRFLRNCEHRLQMVRDEQTHVLPNDECARARLAYTMGCTDWDRFTHELERHRICVHQHFERVFSGPQGEHADAATANAWTDPSAQALAAAGIAASDTDTARDLLRGLRGGGMYAALSVQGRERLDRLMPLLITAAATAPGPALVLTRLVKLIEAIGRRPAYFSLLTENPMALAQLVKLCAASAWIADWISLHPILLDELLHPAHLYADTPAAALTQELAIRLAAVAPDDVERQMEITREFHHAHVLRVAAAEIGTDLEPDLVRHRLCVIAEAVLAQTLTLARAALAQKHGEARCGDRVLGFAVIAYGKLGSYELGYASDLDFVFVHEPCPASGGVTGGARPISHEQFFARLGQRVIHLLTTRTAAGILYPVDMRLRPSGQAGTLVTHLDAFRAYQRESAWIWEHQALVRARAVAGDPRVCAAFTAVRRDILCMRREPRALAQAVLEMRARMHAAQKPHDLESFDLKHDAGGIVDIEFMVQYWVLRFAADHPELTEHTENVRLLQGLSAARRIEPVQMQVLTTAYHRYLSIEQRLKLMEHRALVARTELGEMPAQVQHIWQQVFANEE